jgi:predicted ATP-dependent endonuclease of OLD family
MNEKTNQFSYLKKIDIQNQTVFQQAELHFTPGLNVIIGENGTGKSHLLKLAYSILAVSADEGRKPNVGMPTKTLLQSRLADKLINVFRPETLGSLIQHGRNRKRCEVRARFDNQKLDIHFSFSSQKIKQGTDHIFRYSRIHAPAWECIFWRYSCIK